MPRPVRVGICVVAIAALGFLLAEVETELKLRREASLRSDGEKIARTLEIIRTSTPAVPHVLKVLFYGQSITGTRWHESVVKHWTSVYPDTVFAVENRALGGFDSSALVRATEQDIAEFYPDLIVFHVYGNAKAYERIVQLFRSRTAADVILQTDHGVALPEPSCEEGLHFVIHAPPGCRGILWLRQRDWNDEMSYHILPSLARKYDAALEPQRTWWREYLLRTHVAPRSLLRDDVHPNENGKALIAAFFNAYFDRLVAAWNGQTEHDVTTIDSSKVPTTGGKQTLNFDGSRIEVLSPEALPSWPIVAIDGVSTQALPGCYNVSRASPIATVPDWPAARRITLSGPRVAQEWTASISGLSPDQKSFQFDVRGSVTGEDGAGTSQRDFVSRSGQLSIAAEDWMFSRAFEVSKNALVSPLEVRWTVNYLCGGLPEVFRGSNGQPIQYRYVLAAGLSNAAHVLTMQWAEALRHPLEFRVYKPPLPES